MVFKPSSLLPKLLLFIQKALSSIHDLPKSITLKKNFLSLVFLLLLFAIPSAFSSSIFEEELSACSREKGCFQGGQEKESDFFAFVSFSMPESLWVEMSYGLEKNGGVFVLRGFPKDSFQKFLEKVMDFRKKGINAPVVVDPDAFEKYQITAVPTFVLEKEGGFRKVVGNVSVDYALEKLREETWEVF